MTSAKIRSQEIVPSPELAALLQQAKLPGAPQAIKSAASRALREELLRHPHFKDAENRYRDQRIARRNALIPLEYRATVAASEKVRNDARADLFRFLAKQTRNRSIVTKCGHAMHIAAWNYEMHTRTVVPKLQKIGDAVIRCSDGQPPETPAMCLRRLQRHLSSTPYIWAKAWTAMSPAALETFVLGNPGRPTPIFDRIPSPKAIEPLLPGAIKFAAKPTARTQAKRDELLCTILVAYRLLTGKPPAFSRSPRNPTLKFIRSIEGVYNDFLPGGFDIPVSSHSTLDRLRKRSLLATEL